MEIDTASAADLGALTALYRAAFPDEDLVPLVGQLLMHSAATHWVVRNGRTIIAHIGVTACGLEEDASAHLAILGPVAVHPDHQRSGLGRALIRHGLAEAAAAGMAKTLVLGNPDYYGRSGFTEEMGVATPYPLPDEWVGAWQSIEHTDNAPTGKLSVPVPWQNEGLWA